MKDKGKTPSATSPARQKTGQIANKEKGSKTYTVRDSIKSPGPAYEAEDPKIYTVRGSAKPTRPEREDDSK